MYKRLVKNDSGTVAVMFAFASPVLLLAAAMAVDLSTFYLQKRALQGATDIAAIAAAQNPTQALAAAQKNLALNGFDPSAVVSVQLGNFSANAAVPDSQWFTPGAGGNAVQVNTKIQAPYFFATIMNMMTASTACKSGCNATTSGAVNSATITATATAQYEPEAAFAIGSGLASLNGGVLNAVLGGLLGSNVSFSLMDYQSLASANIDMFAFSNALATRMNLTAVTYNDLADEQVSAPVILGALADAANASPGVALSTVNDLTTLAGLAPNTTIALGQLLSFGDYGTLKVNSPEPITATADALDMVSAIAQLANGTHQVQTALNVNVAPIASATLALTIGERPVGSGFVTIGSAGATVHTAQTRLLLTLQIGQTGSSSLINLPIYIELASGTATLSAISCAADPTQDTVTLAVTPAVIDAWIGNVSSADMTNYSSEPSPSAATLVSIPLVGVVSGRANATITNLSPTPVTFAYSDIVNDVRKTTSTTDFISSLLYNLFANLQLSAKLAGLNVSVPPAASAALGATLATATAPIDQVLTQVLNSLGLSLGNAYTWVSGVKCGTARLVL
jgi:uncharacterized membrane protein